VGWLNIRFFFSSFFLRFFNSTVLVDKFTFANGAVASDWKNFEHFIDAKNAVVMWILLQILTKW